MTLYFEADDVDTVIGMALSLAVEKTKLLTVRNYLSNPEADMHNDIRRLLQDEAIAKKAKDSGLSTISFLDAVASHIELMVLQRTH